MDIPTEVKSAVQAIDKEAEVILFGSRARGDNKVDSDWDFLILTNKGGEIKGRDAIREAVYEVELLTGHIITPIFERPGYWVKQQQTTFFREIVKDGVIV